MSPLPDDLQAHTPGPWHVYAKNPLCIESQQGNVALVNLARASEADARLIAAAPDLLEALRLLAAETKLAGNWNARDYGWPLAIKATISALAKAGSLHEFEQVSFADADTCRHCSRNIRDESHIRSARR